MLKTLGKVLLGVVGVVLLAAAGLYAKASSQLSKVWAVPLSPIAVASDSATIERGRHLASAIFKCTDCHGPDLGGRNPFVDAGPLGVVNSANLTRGEGGIIAKYDDAALARAIRHGVRVDGTPIPIMPAKDFVAASDEDVAAVIAYVRSVPAVNRLHLPTAVRPLGMLLYGAGQSRSTTPTSPIIRPRPPGRSSA